MSKTRVISVANAKGGVGKSTVSILLATALAKQQNQKVLILDTDSQASVSNWLATESQDYEAGTKPLVSVMQENPNHVRLFLEKYGEDYDTVFIDIPRMTNSMSETANVQLLYFCDAILIPVLGSRLDVMSTQKFWTIIQDAGNKRKELGFPFQAFGFINKESNLKDNQEAKTLLNDVLKIPMLDTSLRDLKLFKTTILVSKYFRYRRRKTAF